MHVVLRHCVLIVYSRASTSIFISISRVILLSTCIIPPCCFSKFFFFFFVFLLFSLVDGHWCVSSVVLCVCSVCVHLFSMEMGRDAEKRVCAHSPPPPLSVCVLSVLSPVVLLLCLLSFAFIVLLAGREGCCSPTYHVPYLPLCVCVVCVCLSRLLFLHLPFGMNNTCLDGAHYPALANMRPLYGHVGRVSIKHPSYRLPFVCCFFFSWVTQLLHGARWGRRAQGTRH